MSPAPNQITVLIVDDSVVMRKMLSQIASSDPEICVVGTARDGEDGLKQIEALKPDVVTMDIEMPNLDGLGALSKLKADPQAHKPAVIVCSTLSSAGSHAALKAMRLGAADVIGKDPSALINGVEDVRTELIAKIKAVAKRPGRQTNTKAESSIRVPSKPVALGDRSIDGVFIGSSTGGPPVLELILTALPAEFPCPVFIAQHMPRLFTTSMAERLNELCRVKVVHAEDGMTVERGTVYLCPGGMHLRVRPSASRAGTWQTSVTLEPASALYKPSVNELLASAAQTMGPRALGVVLTGMGDDGLVGAKALHGAGGVILTQDEASCVVYGMPRAVAEAGLSASALPPVGLIQTLRSIRGRGISSASTAA
ncbi:MAG: chemotaxis-specific protein-glutamate methyltransferase CheB [Phycisphaerales bacterium]|nr:MAG: chemotaxis-specific protein-glutamate methyltransferase CheB [Phycisphaerales bacterium]